MYRSRSRLLSLPLSLVALAVAACSETPTDPDGSISGSDLTVSADMELQVAGDADLAEVLVEDAAMSVGLAGDASPYAGARECFRQARGLLREGRADAARIRARECRTQLARAAFERRGEELLDEWFARAEGIVERLGEAGDEFARRTELETRLRELIAEARELRAAGDPVAAGERLLLALQIADRMQHRHPEFDRDPAGAARLAVARGGEALALAVDLVAEPTATQEVLLFRAEEMLRRSRFSFENGWFRRAVAQAHRAEQLSLLAVLDARRPTVQQALQLLALADRLIHTAEEWLDDPPTEAQQRLWEHAVRLRNRGEAAINAWEWRGVTLLWRAAVTAALLIPDDAGAGTP